VSAVIVALVGLLGLIIGSFLNVVIVRVPRGESLLTPSHCPRCGAPVRARHNVPVLSWLALRGRCRDCHAPISARYPLVEAATAIAFAAIAVWTDRLDTVDGAGRALLTATLCCFAAVSIALSLIDLGTQRLPDAIVGPAYLLLPGLLIATCAGTGDGRALLRSALGTLALLAGYYAVHLVRPDGMGFGDVKLAGIIGMLTAYRGWDAFVVGAFAAFVLAGAYGTVLLCTGRATRGSGLPFGPWMLLGGWLGLLVGTPLARGYLHLAGLA
jgi:leader peptidase (prepilin peptidase)/N-methyltransferase